MAKYYRLFVLALALAVSFNSFAAGKIKLRFTNNVNGQPLLLNEKNYVNANGDTFTVSMYKYYVSNISFLSAGKIPFAENESYHLINEAKRATKEFSINDIPTGKYNAIKFMIGVDSLHNIMGAQDGALDPINAMFWDWNTGYIMAKIEGNSPMADQTNIEFHIGGFSGPLSAVRWVTLIFPQPIELKEGSSPIINIASDLAQWFKSPTTIKFSKTPVITTEGKEAVMIADNYADMFTIDSIEP
jgi:hypothetical protein